MIRPLKSIITYNTYIAHFSPFFPHCTIHRRWYEWCLREKIYNLRTVLIRIIKTGKTSYFRPKLSWVLDHVFHIHNIHLLTHSFFFKFARFNDFLSSSPQHVILNELWRMAYGVPARPFFKWFFLGAA